MSVTPQLVLPEVIENNEDLLAPPVQINFEALQDAFNEHGHDNFLDLDTDNEVVGLQTFRPGAVGEPGVIVKALNGHTGLVADFQSGAGTSLASVDKDGRVLSKGGLGIGTSPDFAGGTVVIAMDDTVPLPDVPVQGLVLHSQDGDLYVSGVEVARRGFIEEGDLTFQIGTQAEVDLKIDRAGDTMGGPLGFGSSSSVSLDLNGIAGGLRFANRIAAGKDHGVYPFTVSDNPYTTDVGPIVEAQPVFAPTVNTTYGSVFFSAPWILGDNAPSNATFNGMSGFYSSINTMLKDTQQHQHLHGFHSNMLARGPGGGGGTFYAYRAALGSWTGTTLNYMHHFYVSGSHLVDGHVQQWDFVSLGGPPAGSGVIDNLYGIYLANLTGRATVTYAIKTDGGAVHFSAGAIGVVPLTLRGAASQTANLQEWRKSDETVLVKITSTGEFVIDSSAVTATPLQVKAFSNQTGDIVQWKDSTGNLTGRMGGRAKSQTGATSPFITNSTSTNPRVFVDFSPLYRDDGGATYAGMQIAPFYQPIAEFNKNLTGLTVSARMDLTNAASNQGNVVGLEVATAFIFGGTPRTLTTMRGIHLPFPNIGNGHSVTNQYGIDIVGGVIAAGGVIENSYGIRIRDASGAGDVTAGYGLYIDSYEKAATSYALYTAGGAVRHLAGEANIVPLTVQGAASQNANLQEWVDSSNVVLAKISYTGGMFAQQLQLDGVSGVIAPSLSGATNTLIASKISGDSEYSFVIQADGKHLWGSGSAARDVSIERSAVRKLSLAGNLEIDSLNVTDVPFIVKAFAAQTSDLSQWKDSAGNTIDRIGGRAISQTGITSPILLDSDSVSRVHAGIFPLYQDNGGTIYHGLYVAPVYRPDAESNKIVIGANVEARIDLTNADNNQNALNGLQVGTSVLFGGTPRTVSTVRGVFLNWNNIGNGHSATNVYGLELIGATIAASGTIGTHYGIRIRDAGGAGTVTTGYGLYIDNHAKGATSYAVYTAGGQVRHLAGAVGVVPLVLQAAASQTADICQILDSSLAVLHRFSKTGRSITKKVTAIANADLNNSELTYWLDDTVGATLVMFKAKDSAGNVRTGSVALV